MKRLLIGLVKAYRLLLSPWLGQSCRFTPTCSVVCRSRRLEVHGALKGSYLDSAPHRALPALVPGRPRSGSPEISAPHCSQDRCFRLLSPPTRSLRHERYPPHHPVGDFGFSLVLLWDQWQVFNGNKPTFLPSTKAVCHGSGRPARASSADGVPPLAAVRRGAVPRTARCRPCRSRRR